MTVVDQVKLILGDVLQNSEAAASYTENTLLYGNIPDFDSMSVVNLITAIEENFDIEFDDDEIDADVFESLGSLVNLIEKKL